MSVISKPVNLDGWNFSCGLLRYTGIHTVHLHTYLHSCTYAHIHSLRHTHTDTDQMSRSKMPNIAKVLKAYYYTTTK